MSQAEGTAAPQPRYRIALVDDEPNILSALRRELRDQPFDLVTFDNPELALAALLTENFGLVVSDNLMPNLTGLELLARVKEKQPRTRRILLTGRTDMNHAVEAFNAGAIHQFINKPWNKVELLEAIRKELGIYQEGIRDTESRGQLEAQAKVRGERLLATIKELKQTQTQLVLLEDSSNLDVLKTGQVLRNVSFLIVDEQESVRNLLLAALNGAGIAKCHGEPNAAAALEYLRTSERVDVIVSEWSMQGMDGIAFLRQVRHAPFKSNAALFILMAAIEQRQIVDFAMKSGINDYLVKPFRLATLFASVAKLLPQMAVRRAEMAKTLKDATVLVANSLPASRDQIEQILSESGVRQLHGATFGGAAMALLNEKKPTLVIYDINVKDPNWADVRNTFLSDPASPALLITGVLASPEDWERMRKLGVSNFLPGPFRKEELIEAIANAWKRPSV